MSVTDEVVLKIKDLIVSGNLNPGEKLLPEKELSESLGVSRSSLREAVKALVAFGILVVKRGDGTYVTSLEPAILLEAVSFVADFHNDSSILDIFEVRRLLEPEAVALATSAITPEEIEMLDEIMNSVDINSTLEDLIRHDSAFHNAIISANKNTYLTSMLDSLSNSTIRARIWRGVTQENATQRTLVEHQAILDAIKSGDAALAKALSTIHISGIEQWLKTPQKW